MNQLSDLPLLESAVREAGSMALALLKQGITVWNKPDGSVLTDGDLVIDEFLKSTLTKARPGYGWLSEESPDDPARLAAQRIWIVDPIDGTRSYSKGGSSWNIGASLVENGRPLLSCVYHPQLGRFYSAASGQGTTLNGEKLTLAEQESSLKGLRIMGSKSLTSKLERHGTITVAAGEMPLLARFAMLASGELDATVSVGPKNDWDLAPGELLVTEAGGTVTDLRGNLFNYNQPSRQQPGLVAAAPSRHKAIIKSLEQS
jgi:myo-inositol-1(or 4)-monophosphatase